MKLIANYLASFDENGNIRLAMTTVDFTLPETEALHLLNNGQVSTAVTKHLDSLAANQFYCQFEPLNCLGFRRLTLNYAE